MVVRRSAPASSTRAPTCRSAWRPATSWSSTTPRDPRVCWAGARTRAAASKSAARGRRATCGRLVPASAVPAAACVAFRGGGWKAIVDVAADASRWNCGARGSRPLARAGFPASPTSGARTRAAREDASGTDVYARCRGRGGATAGLHFTPGLLGEIRGAASRRRRDAARRAGTSGGQGRGSRAHRMEPERYAVARRRPRRSRMPRRGGRVAPSDDNGPRLETVVREHGRVAPCSGGPPVHPSAFDFRAVTSC